MPMNFLRNWIQSNREELRVFGQVMLFAATFVTTTLAGADGTLAILHADGTLEIKYADGSSRTEDANTGYTTVIRPDGSSLVINPEGQESNVSADGRTIMTGDGKGWTRYFINHKEIIGGAAPKGPRKKIPTKTPDPENRGSGTIYVGPGLSVGQQVFQSGSGRKNNLGGGADVTPVDQSLTGGIKAGAPAGTRVPQPKTGLVGQPKQGEPENGNGAPPPNPNGDGNVTNPKPNDN